ncbi:hypothetical protein A8L45_20065 [Veronia pacifica]|uniref:Enterobactin synthase component D n=2 Tax=Veronia pacifica TaxID=1080227 RepID=A0A1C3EBC6_9GAMM|nr:hypothetical protein A8L45_20065 [Veronia pacifica]
MLTNFHGVCLAAAFSLEQFSDQDFHALNIALPDNISRSVNKRKAEFLAGRYLAKLALSQLNRPEADIPSGDNRAPIWPVGIAGSISHHKTKAVCALTPAHSPEQGIGIDTELFVCEKTIDALLKTAVNRQEVEELAKAGLTEIAGLTAVFSAKESLFKALFPQVQRYFDFLDVRLVACNDKGFEFALNTTLATGLPKNSRLNVDCYWEPDAVTTFTQSDWVETPR